MKNILGKILLVLTGIVGAFMAAMILIASLLLIRDDLLYGLGAAGLSLIALIGSVASMIMAWGLNADRKRKTAWACFLLGAVFLGMVFLLSAPRGSYEQYKRPGQYFWGWCFYYQRPWRLWVQGCL